MIMGAGLGWVGQGKGDMGFIKIELPVFLEY